MDFGRYGFVKSEFFISFRDFETWLCRMMAESLFGLYFVESNNYRSCGFFFGWVTS